MVIDAHAYPLATPSFGAVVLALALATQSACAADMADTPQSHGTYRLPFADGTHAKVFDDFLTHRPQGRVDLYAVDGAEPYRVVAAAAGRIAAIQDGYNEQQSGRAAALCHNNYVWISHPMIRAVRGGDFCAATRIEPEDSVRGANRGICSRSS